MKTTERPRWIQEHMLWLIENKSITRDNLAVFYAFAIAAGTPGLDVADVSRAVIDRWSVGGLMYIKQRAWALHDSTRAALSGGAK